MAAILKSNEANLQAVSDILGATDTGLTGSENPPRETRLFTSPKNWRRTR
jgi:hypothetical protein